MIKLDSTLKGLQFTLSNKTWIGQPPVRYAGVISFHIVRKGCHSGEPLIFRCIKDKYPQLTVMFDPRIYQLKRGYYEGYLEIGCEKTCVVDFFAGQDLCMDTTPVTGKALCQPSPDCTESCDTLSQAHDAPPAQFTYTPVMKHKKSGAMTLLVGTTCGTLTPECESC